MKFSDETLMAYADGELNAVTSAEIEAAMATDPAIAAIVARHQQLKRDLQDAFDTASDGEVPERLIAAARNAPTTPDAVTDIASVRQSSAKRRWSYPEWGAIAASLLIGIVIARMPWGTEQSIVANEGRMTAGGELATALERQLSGARIKGSAVHIGLSYRARTGEYCRTFVMSETSGVSGIACRQADAWRVVAVASSEPAESSDRYRMAGTSVAPLILQAVQDSIAGNALDAADETSARDRGWK